MAIARDFSPRIERHGACVVLDVSGLGRLLGDPQAIGAELDRVAADRVAGIDRVALAPTQTAARLMAIAQPGVTVVTGDVASALAALPIDTLRVLVADGGYDAGRATRTTVPMVRLKPDATSGTARMVRLKPDATSGTVRLKPDARGGDHHPARHVPALGAHHPGRGCRSAGRRSLRADGAGRPRAAAAGVGGRSDAARPGSRCAPIHPVDRSGMADRRARAAVVRARAPARPAVGRARARRSRGGGAAARSPPRRSDGARTPAAAAGRDA